MPFDRDLAVLEDMREYIQHAQAFTQGLDVVGFGTDAKTLLATLRCLEVLSEASRRLSEGLKARHPGIDWKRLAAAGNVYRHEYDGIDVSLVWRAVQNDVPPLLVAVEAELA